MSTRLIKIFRRRHQAQKGDLQRQTSFPLEIVQPLKPAGKEKSVFIRGHSCLYLGKVPTYESKGVACTDYCVEKLLDRYNIDEGSAHEVYLDVKSLQLVIYYTDDDGKLLHTEGFDLARVSYACGSHIAAPRIFSWVYKQENDSGFQLECHAVRCSSSRKTQIIAQQLFVACQKLYQEIRAGLESNKLFDEQEHDQTECASDHTALISPSATTREDMFPSMADWEDLELDNDSVFDASETSSLNNAILDLHLANMGEQSYESNIV